jgi:glycosyltransferase involved in cell wall biosynthesis
VRGWCLLHMVHRYYPFRGGSELYFQALSEHMAADGANVAVVTTDAWDLEYFWDPRRRRIDVAHELHEGVRIYRVPVRHLPLPRLTHQGVRRVMIEFSRFPAPVVTWLLSRLGRLSPWLPALDSTLREAAPDADLVHVGNVAFEPMIASAVTFARQRDIPSVVTPNIHLGESERSVVRRHYTMPHQIDLLRKATMITTNTRVEAEYLEGQGVPADNIRVMGVGLRREGVTGGDGRAARIKHRIEGPVVLALGVAAYDKGTLHVARAVADLNRRRAEPITMVVAGPVFGTFSAGLDALAAEDRRHIRVLGFVSDEDRRDLLAACDLLAMPSRTDAYGYVFLEAWANHKPVIGARAGGIPAVIDHGENGLLVDFGDVPAIARAIKTLVEDPKLSAKFGLNGAAKIMDEDEWYRRFADLYSALIGTPAPQAASAWRGQRA